jgi:hypothetical protein
VTTTTSRSVAMIYRTSTLNPVIDVRPRWQWCTRSSSGTKTESITNRIQYEPST